MQQVPVLHRRDKCPNRLQIPAFPFFEHLMLIIYLLHLDLSVAGVKNAIMKAGGYTRC